MTGWLRITQQPDGWIRLEHSYCPDFVEYLKKRVPKDCRRWFFSEKCWRVEGDYFQFILKMGQEVFGQENVTVSRMLRSDALKILGLLASATFDEIKDAYRKNALKFHPDQYKGRQNMMVLLNWAYDILR